MKPEVVAIVAVARNGVIGAENGLPWRISSDMKRFKALTMGKPLILGRRTHQSLPRPLPGRELIVVTRDANYAPSGVRVAGDPAAALRLARAVAAEMSAPQICIGGGGEIYRALLDATQRIELTEIDLAPEGDAYFPTLDPLQWREVLRAAQPRGEKDEADFAYVTLERRSDRAP
jgi:dihydrofolate reductase